jgi:hypothetical protein
MYPALSGSMGEKTRAVSGGEGIHVNGEGNYGFCGSDCYIDTVSLAEILESLIGANARTGIQRNKDSVVFGNTLSNPK